MEALQSHHQQGDGIFTAKASKVLSDMVGGGHVLLTPSCTHALEMASMLANLGPGDEVILPSYTFTSGATAVTKFGATPVFVDVELNSKVIDINQVREAISPKTKAISWVNYAGVAPDIEGLQTLAKEFNLLLIEDNAHGLGGIHNGRPLGSFGDFATQSFHATKNIQCGEGGALIINNQIYKERAEIIREKGTNRSKFIRNEVKKYQWIDQGSSYLLAEVLAALLLGQLENLEDIQSKRKQIFTAYFEQLKTWATINNFQLPFVSSQNLNSYHMFYLFANSELERNSLIQKLSHNGIAAAFHYQSLAKSKFGMKHARVLRDLRISEKISNQLVRLPFYYHLDHNSQTKVINQIIK
jgi:dTDP-4-amino-4,6-dideoxygalactose transaminase